MPQPLYSDPGNGQLFQTIKVQTCSGQPLEVTTASGNTVYMQPATTAGDAFGRLRVSNPYTLFDSSHRYTVNGHWATLTGVSGTFTFNADQGLVDIKVGTNSGSKVYRETNRVFAYQPGKSLLTMSTFVMSSGQANLRQRVGYFSSGNGIYFQQSGTTYSIVERSSVSGSVAETIVPQSSWNGDKLDGSGESQLTLDPTKSQIFWSDIEWLGVGTVRTGFVINGKFILCHSFHHANIVPSTYITTATLPVRYEIEALNTLTSSGTLKQVCSTVISEGGYETRGDSMSVALPVSGFRTLTNSGEYYPAAAIRLKSTRLDGVVVPNAMALIGEGNNALFAWRVVKGGTVSGGTWTSAGTDSNVEYNLSGVSVSGGTVMTAGYFSADTQSKNVIELPSADFFKYQLERDSFTATPTEFIVEVAGRTNGDKIWAALDWEEVSK